jgi:hypothetical protein
MEDHFPQKWPILRICAGWRPGRSKKRTRNRRLETCWSRLRLGQLKPICQGTVQCPPWAGWGASSIACPTSLDGKSIKVMGKTALGHPILRILIENGARVMLKCWSGTSWFYWRCTLCNCNSGPIWPECPGHHTLCADLYLPFRWFTPRTSRSSRASQVRYDWLCSHG